MVLRGLQKEVIKPLIGYIHYETPEEEQNFATLLGMLNSMDVREDDEEYQNPTLLSKNLLTAPSGGGLWFR